MTTTITNVTELQAMSENLAENYVLGNNIDASETSTWNEGAGFSPIGLGAGQTSYSRPWSDDFGYAGSGGSWTIYPSDGVFFDKVDEETSDNDTTYIQATTDGDWVLLSHEAADLDIPDDATNIVVKIQARVRNVASGTSYIQGMLNIDGTEYLVGSNLAVSSQTYALKTWTMTVYPPTSSEWTVGEVFSLGTVGVGVKVSDASPDIRITQLYIQVSYDLIFTGTFDGAGYTISGLFINRPPEDDVGLFGRTNGATISKLTLASPVITGKQGTGSLIGYCIDTTISDITVTTATITGRSYSGGIIGYCESCTATDCSVTGTVNSALAGMWSLGGFTGYAYGTYTRCHADVDVNGSDMHDVGGFAGYCGSAAFSQCYALGDVISIEYAGGFIGDTYAYNMVVTFTDCYARGNVHSAQYQYAGGFLGVENVWGTGTTTCTNCYSTGAVTIDGIPAEGYLGGFAADDSGRTTYINCFWDTQTSGVAYSAGGTGKTTAQMKLQLTYSGWDFTTIWAMDSITNNGYPYFGTSRCYTIPALLDDHGRIAKGARVRAYRDDTGELIKEGIIDSTGHATICGLPKDTDVTFHVTWGGGA